MKSMKNLWKFKFTINQMYCTKHLFYIKFIFYQIYFNPKLLSNESHMSIKVAFQIWSWCQKKKAVGCHRHSVSFFKQKKFQFYYYKIVLLFLNYYYKFINVCPNIKTVGKYGTVRLRPFQQYLFCHDLTIK